MAEVEIISTNEESNFKTRLADLLDQNFEILELSITPIVDNHRDHVQYDCVLVRHRLPIDFSRLSREKIEEAITKRLLDPLDMLLKKSNQEDVLKHGIEYTVNRQAVAVLNLIHNLQKGT